MSLLRVRGLDKRFGGVHAVCDLSFDVHPQTIKALIGPNGAGKSTVFNLLTGFERPDSGSARFADAELIGLRPHEVVRRGVVRTFQESRLFDSMTVEENVLAGMHLRLRASMLGAAVRASRVRAEEREARVEAAHVMRMLGIERHAHLKAGDLPHGLRRVLEVARALAARPRLLLLDEPAAGLDGRETEDLADALLRIKDTGVTLLIVEHDMGLVMEVSDEIVVIDQGRKIAEGPPLLIQKDPAVLEAYLGEVGDRV
ncbi:MAG: ABC transporter ATP-binding protein [Anaerosomatales bacterium]|nr:ABC transporter ATP-binding protein [Anaerosomatales bacterium]MDI6844216.1 ABC transporter ATP-binding protein [Anaerosomatales bacterium]